MKNDNEIKIKVDKLANIRTLQNRVITQTSIRNTIYELVKKIRGVGKNELKSIYLFYIISYIF